MYRYDNYTDSFVRMDAAPNTGSTTVSASVPLVPLKEKAVIVKKVELTDDCINEIADAVVRNYIETVGIVRCKDCRWFGKIGCAIKIVDDSDKPKENDFCSFAERRADD